MAAYPGIPEQAGNPGISRQAAYPGIPRQGAYPGIQGQGAYPGTSRQGAYPGIPRQGAYPGIPRQGAYPGIPRQAVNPDPSVVIPDTNPDSTEESEILIRFDPSYFKTVPGIVKIAQIGFSLLGFICIQVSFDRGSPRGKFYSWIAMIAISFSGILLALYVYHVVEKYQHKVPWLKIELGFCVLWTLFFLLASSLTIGQWGNNPFIAAGSFHPRGALRSSGAPWSGVSWSSPRQSLKIDSVWGWASPPLRLQLGNSRGHKRMGEGGSPGGGARLSHTSEKHPRAVLGELSALRRHRELCDVVLNVANRKLFAHRVILSACSPYFRAMFTGELAESRATEVTIRDVDEQAMEQLVEFCYTAHIVVEESNVQALLPAACLLQLQEIQDVCCEFLKRQLDCSNCLGIRAFADTHSCRDLLRIADKFTQQNFPEVMESEEFLLLPAAQLIDIVSSDELNVRSEEQTFQAVMSWVKYNVAERRQHLAQVLQHVRLPLLSPKFLVGTVSSELLIRSDDACRDLLDEAKNYLLLPQERPLMQGPRTRPRKPTRRGEVLFAVGGWCSGDAIASVERFDPQTAEWKMVAPMSKRRCGVGVAVLHDLLYAVGGHDGQSYLNSIERYDPQTNQWCGAVAPTSSCRTSVGVAVLEGALYAVGGQDGVQCLNHVERYEPKENRWTKVAAMTTRRLGVAVAVLGGALYAVGGSDGQSPLNTVERYDPRANKWTAVAPMSTRRKHLGCAVFDGQIYAVGGRDDCTELSSAEKYDPGADAWSPVVAMTSRRSGVGLAVVNGQLYAVGGFDGTAYLKSIEVFDPESNQWRLCGAMNYRRLGGGVGVMRAPHHDTHYIWNRKDSVV